MELFTVENIIIMVIGGHTKIVHFCSRPYEPMK